MDSTGTRRGMLRKSSDVASVVLAARGRRPVPVQLPNVTVPSAEYLRLATQDCSEAKLATLAFNPCLANVRRLVR